MPTVIIPDKICSHCGGTEWYYYENKNSYSCRNEQKEKRKVYASTPKGKAILKAARDRYLLKNKQYCKDYYEKNKEKFKLNSYNYRKTERGKEALKRAKNKQSENLTDYYIVNNYYINVYVTEGIRINRKDITQEQIEILRNKIKLERELNLTSYEKRKKSN
jgi:DNA-binding PadR family transcriptional regulator